MEGTEVPPWLELIPVELPTIGQAIIFDQLLKIADIIQAS